MNDRNLDAIDLMKLILACLMVPTHMQAFQDRLPVMIFLSRFTIPLFFMTSSFFFYRGLEKKPGDTLWRRQRLRHFLLRVFRLYLVWELVQLPITIRNWNGPALTEAGGLLYFLIRLLLGNTFFASWYLKALMIGILIVTVLSTGLGNRGLLGIGLTAYLLCCLNSGYAGLKLCSIHAVFLPNTFLAALIWLVLGKIIAEMPAPVRAFHNLENRKKRLILAVTVLLFTVEYCLCMRMKWAEQTDNMMLLIPACTVVFLLVLESRKQFRGTEDMRSSSTFIYCAHGSVMAVLFSVGKRIGVEFETAPGAYLCYVLILIICSAAAVCVNRLKKKPQLRWLGWFC